MFKYILLLIIPFLFIGSTQAFASVSDWKQEASRIEKQRQDIKEKIVSEDNKNKIVSLTMKDNDLAAYQEAYEKAIEITKSNMVLKEDPGSFQPINLLEQEIPSEYIAIYQAAGEKYGVEWYVLASIHKIETNFSSINEMISSVGAVGHMQFMPQTWQAYGVDANGDNIKDPYNIEDSIFSAANYLSDMGAAQDISQALFAYNHANWYVDEVLQVANSYREAFTHENIPVVEVGKKYIGDSIYVLGGGRTKSDINKGIFDCSSFIRWSFTQVGINVGNLSSTTTDTLKKLGERVNLENVQPGDLVFFDTYKKDGHVGIYAGNGKFIGAQSSTGVAIEDMTTGFWKKKFNGRVIRIKGI